MFFPLAFAHGSEATEAIVRTVDPTQTALHFMYGAVIFLALTLIVCLLKKQWSPGAKVTIFTLMCVVSLFTTAGLAGTTIELNLSSPTKGPIHWHADFKMRICGKEVELKDPKGLSNKVGTPLLHEHNDGRIHMEGTPRSLALLTLGKFFEVVGGSLSATSFQVQTLDDTIRKTNGDACNGAPGTLSVFLQKEKEGVRTWEVLSDPVSYVISPEENVPPGDRIFIIFDAEDSATLLTQLPNLWK